MVRIAAETGFGSAADDVLDFLQEAEGVGLQLVRHELPGR